ncbi:MAG TPA: hypothetical protein VM661_11940 [Candidatus Sulfotelmatobacter sp.]|jgi:exo-beta-1,3-glucanase (GH17 family)|nr:hypothetical protein [Candidatus Sulfotelmatobacter sp.]
MFFSQLRAVWLCPLIFAVSALCAVLAASWLGRPVPVNEPPLHKLGCVSFAHPENVLIFGKRPPVDPADIERELTRISQWTDCIRVYSSDARQEQVVPMAQKLGLKVLLGAWINSHPETSKPELERALAIAAKYPDTVKALVVGNEVLTVKEMPVADLIPYLDEARRRSNVPVTIAEVWSIWLQYPELADHVDFIGAHILPYWDGAPASMDKALTFVEDSLSKLEARFPGKDILIAETGWPSGGRAKGGLAPGVVEQSTFVRAVAAMAARHHWSYNIVESYDQPWKRYSEGVAGGTWGLFDTEGHPKFSFDGPAIPERRWPVPATAAVLLGGVGLALFGRRSPKAAALAPWFGLLLGFQGLFLLDWISGWVRAAMAAGLFAASLLMAKATLRALAQHGLYTLPTWRDLFVRLLRPRSFLAASLGSYGGLCLFYQAAAVILCVIRPLMLLHEKEPPQIPSDYYSLVFSLPVLMALLVVRGTRRQPLLGCLLPASGVLAVAMSGFNVPQAWVWGGLCCLLSLPCWRAAKAA